MKCHMTKRNTIQFIYEIIPLIWKNIEKMLKSDSKMKILNKNYEMKK